MINILLLSHFIFLVLSYKPMKVGEIVLEKAKSDANTTPLAKLCFKCVTGTASNAECMTGRQINDENVTCEEGYCVLSASNCTVCPADGLNPLGVSECTNCSYGFYSAHNQSASCDECEVKFYCPGESNSMMVSCPIGWFCNQTKLAEPFPCPKGTYCPQIELTEPKICPAGRFCLGGTEPPIPCPENTKCPAGTAFPIDCPSLFISDKMSSVCSPTIAFWVIAGISIVSIFIFFGWLFFKISNMAMIEQEEIKSQEITKIIPPVPNGPQYTGL